MRKGLQTTIDNIEKAFGKFSVITSDSKAQKDIEIVSSGSLLLDHALGVGGYPFGRIIEIYGQESSGKTTLCLHAIANTQKMGYSAVFIDAEHSLDVEYAKALGIQLTGDNPLLISQPDDGDQALNIVEHLVKSGEIRLIIIDSVAALTPKAEIDGEMGDSKMGLHARLMSQALRKITGVVNKNKCLIIFTNQMREKIGISWGNPWTTTGGNALKFYATIRLEVSRIGSNKDGETVVSNKTRVKVVKNKVAPPFKQAEFDIFFGQGIDESGEILDISVEAEIVKKSGSWFSYGKTKLGQGRISVIELLKDNPELRDELRTKVLEILF